VKLLFVENHSVFAETVVGQFLREHHVTIASTVEEAMRLFDGGQFDAVLVDYDLDDAKGDVFVRHVRAAGSSIPIVAASAHADGNAALRAAGANVACPKAEFRRIAAILRDLTRSGDRNDR
jgi:CheY-like chemotaxis protein